MDAIPGNSITNEQAVANNDVQIFEEWLGRSDIWNKAVDQGDVAAIGKHRGRRVGSSRCVIEGDKKRHRPMAPIEKRNTAFEPGLARLFADPEEPSRGNFWILRPVIPPKVSTRPSS